MVDVAFLDYPNEVALSGDLEDDMYNPVKAAHVIAYLGLKAKGRTLEILKLVKLIYIADREQLKTDGLPVLYEPRASLPSGPVNSMTYDRMKGAIPVPDEWNEVLMPLANHRLTVRDGVDEDDLGKLSDMDAETLDRVWNEYGHLTSRQLVDWTHDPKNVPEWEDPRGSSKPIALERLLAYVGIEDPVTHAAFIEGRLGTNQMSLTAG